MTNPMGHRTYEFDVKYQPRSAIKAQVLADFIAEFTSSQRELDEVDKAQKWVVYSTYRRDRSCFVVPKRR